MRTGIGWSDATIRNLSAGGMMLQTPHPLRRSQFVEVARGRHRVVGRIVWSADSVCGLQAREQVDIAGLLAPADNRPEGRSGDRRVCRRLEGGGGRRAPAFADSIALLPLLGRAFERALLVAALASVSIVAVGSALAAADAPVEEVRAAAPTMQP